MSKDELLRAILVIHGLLKEAASDPMKTDTKEFNALVKIEVYLLHQLANQI